MSQSIKWQYGDSWEKFPIVEGETWAHSQSGSTIAVHDLRNPLPAFMRADIVYCDPPWNQGNVNSFITKAGMDSYVSGFGGFLDTLFNRITEIGPDVCYLETGKQHLTDVETLMGAQFYCTETWEIRYYKKHPCFLVRGAGTPSTAWRDFGIDFTGMDDTETPTAAIRVESPQTVADLCTGRGLTLLAAHAHGARFVGTELNRRRLAVAIDRAAKRGWNYAKDSVQ